MKKKIVIAFVMTMLAGVMLAGCGKKTESTGSDDVVVEEETETEEPAEPEAEPEPEPEPEPPKSYVEESGLEFSQGTSFTTKGVRWNPDNAEDYEQMDAEAKISSVTVADTEQEGYQTITIEVISNSEATEEKTSFRVPSFSVCDIYTGRIVPDATLKDGEVNEIQYQADLEWEGEQYSVSYVMDMEINGQWEGNLWPFDMTFNYIITVPKNYDGMALLMCPETEYEETEAGVIDEEEKYIMDEWKEGSYLLRMSDLLAAFGS